MRSVAVKVFADFDGIDAFGCGCIRGLTPPARQDDFGCKVVSDQVSDAFGNPADFAIEAGIEPDGSRPNRDGWASRVDGTLFSENGEGR